MINRLRAHMHFSFAHLRRNINKHKTIQITTRSLCLCADCLTIFSSTMASVQFATMNTEFAITFVVSFYENAFSTYITEEINNQMCMMRSNICTNAHVTHIDAGVQQLHKIHSYFKQF